MVYFITQQSSHVVPALRSLVPGDLMSGDSLLADEGSASLRSHGTHGRLSDKRTVNAGRDSCEYYEIPNFTAREISVTRQDRHMDIEI